MPSPALAPPPMPVIATDRLAYENKWMDIDAQLSINIRFLALLKCMHVFPCWMLLHHAFGSMLMFPLQHVFTYLVHVQVGMKISKGLHRISISDLGWLVGVNVFILVFMYCSIMNEGTLRVFSPQAIWGALPSQFHGTRIAVMLPPLYELLRIGYSFHRYYETKNSRSL